MAQKIENKDKNQIASQTNANGSDMDEIKLDIDKKDKQPAEDYFPLEGATQQDEKKTTSGISYATPIPEPAFKKPQPDQFSKDKTENKETKTTIANPISAEQLSPDDKKLAAEQLVDLLLRGYGKIKDFANWYVKLSDDEIMSMVNENSIDMNMVVPLTDDGSKYCTVSEFIQNYNKQADQSIKVSEPFKSAIRPPMIRTCIKNNWGMSDEVYIAWLLGEDISVTIVSIYSFKKTMLKCLKAFQTIHKQNIQDNTINNAQTSSESNPTPEPIQETIK